MGWKGALNTSLGNREPAVVPAHLKFHSPQDISWASQQKRGAAFSNIAEQMGYNEKENGSIQFVRSNPIYKKIINILMLFTPSVLGWACAPIADMVRAANTVMILDLKSQIRAAWGHFIIFFICHITSPYVLRCLGDCYNDVLLWQFTQSSINTELKITTFSVFCFFLTNCSFNPHKCVWHTATETHEQRWHAIFKPSTLKFKVYSLNLKIIPF